MKRIFPILLVLALCAAAVLVVTAPQKSAPADAWQNPFDKTDSTDRAEPASPETPPPAIPAEA
ncbi:MAG: hypothetical protein II836_08710, partial [Clostridia bacterium]|nr:hypothetical protein [Clostridia bacterium]